MPADTGAFMKTRLAVVLLYIAVGFPNATYGQTSAAQTSAVCSDAALPAPVNELLKTKFAGWRPQQDSDLYADDQKFWTDAHPKECPGIAVGHFESAEILSYAVLLLPRSKQNSGYQIVVFNKTSNAGIYTWRLLEREEGKSSFAPFIYKVPPGKYVGFDETKSVRLKLDGINVEWIEKSSFIDYWWGGRYRKMWTSD
jgi:hypothetical protein